MISANASQLITIGIVLVLFSFIFPHDPQKLATVVRKILFGLVKVMRLVGIAALIAGAIIILLPMLHKSDLTTKNLHEINENVERYHHWLEMSWMVMVPLCLSLLASVWFGLSEVTAAQARTANRAVRITSTAKIVAGFLACCSFVGAGIEGSIKDRVVEAEATAQKLDSLQLILFRHIEHQLERELISGTIHQASQQSRTVQQTIAAFNVAAPFLPDRPTFFAVSNDGDVHESSARQDSVPDVSLTQIAKVEEELKSEPKDDSPEGVLIEDIVHLTYDNTVSDGMKKYLLHIGNPIISEIVSAFLDPLFGESAEKLVRDQARRIMQDHFDRSTTQAQLNEGAALLRSDVNRKVAAAQTGGDTNSGNLGDPLWDKRRVLLRQVVMAGLPRKIPLVQNDARVMMARFDRFWEAVGILVRGDQERVNYSERAFSAYLKQNPDFVALWGYIVISVTPSDYEEDLRAIAEQVGPPKSILEPLKDLVRMKSLGDSTAATSIAKYDPEDELTRASTDADYGRVWNAYHGPYPLYGYLLYQKKIGDSPFDEAEDYYSSESVSRFVGIYCPNNKDTSMN